MRPSARGRRLPGVPTRAHGLRWLMGFGTLGLFAVLVIDSSIIPLPVPGSTDLLLILLVAHRGSPVFAAVAATAGSIFGGYLTWATGEKGGEAALHRYLPRRFGKRLQVGGEEWDGCGHRCPHCFRRLFP